MARETARRRKRRSTPTGPVQRPWRRVRNPYKPIEVLSADHIEHIHRASLDVLEQLGIDIWLDEVIDLLEAAGAEVDRAARHVRLDRGLVEEAVGHAPAEFTLTPRNPERAVTMGGSNVNFGIVGGPGFSTNLDRGRRGGTFADARDLLRIGHSLNALHIVSMNSVAATDLPVPTRHLETYRASVHDTDKV